MFHILATTAVPPLTSHASLPVTPCLLYSPIMKRNLILFAIILLLAACARDGEETAVPPTIPTPTPAPTTEAIVPISQEDFIVIATDAPLPPFTEFDKFGDLDGFDSRLMENIAVEANLDYEFVVTPSEGVLENLATNPGRDFNAAMSRLVIPQEPIEGIVYSQPYLEVGQVLVVLVDEERIGSYQDLQAGMAVGVVQNSEAEQVARLIAQVNESDLRNGYSNSVEALQALVDESLTAVITDSYVADYFSQTYSDQIKIVGGNGRGGWISQKAYGIALSAANTALLERLNEAITAVNNAGHIERLTVAWLLPSDTLTPGEPRIVAAPNEMVIGIVGDLSDLDPAARFPNLSSWEIKINTMSGLYAFDAQNVLNPMLATNLPTISEDKLEYTINLRHDLHFPDGSEFTAEDVKWSIERARSLGNFWVNGYLKDSNEDGFADADAVQIVDQFTVKFVLQEPDATFLSLLATPPYFPISNECYSEAQDNLSSCGGLGPYTIVSWTPGEQMRLRANPEWPGRPVPAFENILVRFQDNTAVMRRSLEQFQSIDIAWTGLPYSDFTDLSNIDANGDGLPDYKTWTGPAAFKSYIIFNQEQEPWDSAKVRQAFALSVDRTALANGVFDGSRLPLFSPIPDTVPGHLPVLPQRNLPLAQSLLLEEGYSDSVPLEIELWYVNDGRYSNVEAAYVTALQTQLEETGVFKVTLSSAPFESFIGQVGACNYPAYLMGWPSPGRPTDYLDPSAWTDFFVNSNSFCPNYDSPAMTAFLETADIEIDPAARLAIYGDIQQLWAQDFPTLDLLQEPRIAVSLDSVNNVQIDAMGLLHYEVLNKGGG
ncbi:MAG: transporter substrate-binding domain-containing protein [Chloroflexi bacterium]|nr:transporter substrate-binding domain-containing protein [Chloroflexota bacterium]